jgi:hypothetical protein
MRAVVFSLSAAVLFLSTLGIGLDAAFSGGYGCMGPPSIIFMPVFAICGVACLTLAATRRERVSTAVVLALGTVASAVVLVRPSGYPTYEAVALTDVRTVLSAEAAYQGVNQDYVDTLECLAKPSSCIPGYPATSPTFLDVSLTRPEPKNGYRRWLVSGPPVENLPSSASRTSTRHFAYVAVPLDSRWRSFCADETGVIFQAPKGITPNIRDGHCDDPRFVPYK